MFMENKRFEIPTRPFAQQQIIFNSLSYHLIHYFTISRLLSIFIAANKDSEENDQVFLNIQ